MTNCCARYRLSDLDEITPWLLGWGTAAEVIAPLELRKRIRAGSSWPCRDADIGLTRLSASLSAETGPSGPRARSEETSATMDGQFEIVIYRLKPDVDRSRFMEISNRATEWLRQSPWLSWS